MHLCALLVRRESFLSTVETPAPMRKSSPPPLRVNRRAEPGRLGQTLLEQAYERLLPIHTRIVEVKLKAAFKPAADPTAPTTKVAPSS